MWENTTNINSDSAECILVTRTFCQQCIVNSAMFLVLYDRPFNPLRQLLTWDYELFGSNGGIIVVGQMVFFF